MFQRLLSGPLYEITLCRARGCPPSGLKLFFPVICSAATLTHAISDYQCLIPWLRMNDPRHIPSRVVPWFDRWFILKTKGELTLVVLTIVGGYIACSSTSGWARLMYPYGTLFASCHLIFAPDIGRCVRKIVDNRMDTRGPLRLFLRRHTLRILTMDIPAFFCFLKAFRHASYSALLYVCGSLTEQCLAVYTLISVTGSHGQASTVSSVLAIC
ncbi:hypothetical protein EDD15DRAFT_1121335 [Pisolithus albus]|nr:hypothetical protein EDD15DRAFT_1121335 [Pisolithus albus]